jgi:hypothetical protein
MAFLFSWVVALFWTAHDEHKRRLVVEGVVSGTESRTVASLRTSLTAAIREGREIFMAPEDGERAQRNVVWTTRTTDLLERALGPSAADGFRSDRYGTGPDHIMTGKALVSRKVHQLEGHLKDLGHAPIMEDRKP